MLKEKPNKRYTSEFKQTVIETMMKERLSYSEAARRFENNDPKRIMAWERIYLTEGPEGFLVERRGRGSKGRPPKQLPKAVEDDLLAEMQRLRAENDYLKNLQVLDWKTSDASGEDAGSSKAEAKTQTGSSTFYRSTASGNVLLPSETDGTSR